MIFAALDDLWPGPLLISDDQHSSIFIQTPGEYIYACSLRGAPQDDVSGHSGLFLCSSSWLSLAARALQSCTGPRDPTDCHFEIGWLLSDIDLDLPPIPRAERGPKRARRQ